MRKKYDCKSITIHDVAKEAGVSKSTVSLVLTQSDKVSKKSKLKVEQAIDKTGYVYNRDAASLRSRQSNLVAIVINDLANAFTLSFVKSIETKLRNSGMFSMLVTCNDEIETQTKLVNQLKEYNVNSFVICPVQGTNAEWLNDLVKQGYGVINILREVSAAKVATVLPDYYLGIKLAMTHLLEQGFEKIAFIGSNTFTSEQQKISAYKDALQESGLEILAFRIKQTAVTRHDGRQAINQLLKDENDIEAIVCATDVIAYGVIDILCKKGKKIGNEIAIIGFEDLVDSSLMSPALSSVHVDMNKMADAVLQQLQNTNNRNKILVEIDLITRETS